MSSKFITLFIGWLILFSSPLFSAENVLPHQEWKTLKTQHFRIHYTPEYRAWAVSAAHEMEASVEVIKKSQNRSLPELVDVVVFDPLNDSNGFAIPFSTKPIMALYATAPESNSMIANSSSWQQLLALHEYVHLVHLAQPNRNELTQAIARYWDLYDVLGREEISRWVAEGYATLQESKLTGRGRLYDAQVEAMIRQFAREGALPRYSELSQVEGKYRIGSMAYLMGVRFLYWLEENYSEAALDAVWTRVQAKERRTFEQAFKGVFLEEPEYLYQRFIAEYTYKVMAEEMAMGKSSSELWFDAAYDLNSPVLSPGQKLLAFVETNAKRDSQIKVVEIQQSDKQATEFQQKMQEITELDPEDIPAKQPKVFNRKAKYRLRERNFAGIRNLRWFDSETIWFTAATSDSKGFRHQDLFQWHLPSGAVKQLTQQANLRRFDVDKASGTVIAEKTRFGKSGLVKLSVAELGSANKGSFITANSMENVFDFPLLNPANSTQLAYLKSALNQPWGLYIKDLSSEQADLSVPMPKGYQFLSYPQWSADGESLYFVAGSGSKIKLYQYNLASKELFAVTQGQEMMAWPIELQQGDKTSLLHVSIMSRGPDIFKRDLAPQQLVKVTELQQTDNFDYLLENTKSETLITDAQLNLSDEIGIEQDYDVWQQDQTLTLTGTRASASYASVELGLKGGDLIQRLNWNLNAMVADKDLESGFSGNVKWQGLPVLLSGHFYHLSFSEQAGANFQQQYADGEDRDLTGYSFGAAYPYGLASSTYRGEASVRYLFNGSAKLDTKTINLQHKQSWFLDRVKWGIQQHSDLHLLSGESSGFGDSDDWRGVQGSFGLAANAFGYALAVNYEHAERTDSELSLLQLGGIGSGVINPTAHANWLLSPELGLGSALGNKFKNTRVSFYKRQGSWQLYYSKPQMDGSDVAEIVGLRNQTKFSLFRSGLTDVMIEYGLAKVKPEGQDSNLEGWLSLRYQY